MFIRSPLPIFMHLRTPPMYVFIHFHNLCGVCSVAKTLTIRMYKCIKSSVSTTIRKKNGKKNLAATKCAPLWQNMFLILEFNGIYSANKEKRKQDEKHRLYAHEWTIGQVFQQQQQQWGGRTGFVCLQNIQTSSWNCNFYHLAFFLCCRCYLLLSFAPEHSTAAHAVS